MADHLLHRNVSGLFRQRRAPKTLGVGVEQELLTRDLSDGSVPPIDRVRRAVRGSSYERWVGFEPGGQLELSLPCAPLPRFAECWEQTIASLRADCAGAGIRLDAAPVDDRPVPRQLTSRRYVAMESHFDRIGPAGRRMMRRTASTQVCLDWWPGEAGREQWRLALLAGPFLARSVRPERRPGVAVGHLAVRRPLPHGVRRPAAARCRPGDVVRRLRRRGRRLRDAGR